MIMTQHIFIDDSGDPGLKKSNTFLLVVAAVVIINYENVVSLSTAINGFREALRWNKLHEFKFNSTEKRIVKDLLRIVSHFEFTAHAVIIDKTKIVNSLQLPPNENLYNFAIKELLLKLKLSAESIIVIDGVADKNQIQRMRTYLRQALKQQGVEKCKINFVDSRKEPLVQLADIIAGSVARSYDITKSDRNVCVK